MMYVFVPISTTISQFKLYKNYYVNSRITIDNPFEREGERFRGWSNFINSLRQNIETSYKITKSLKKKK